MPHTFDDIESGSSLSSRLLEIAPRFLNDLKSARIAGRVTPTEKITGKLICAGYRKFKINLSGADVRALVNYWRQMEEPIMSEGDGYCYATSSEELENTILQLTDRVRAQYAALAGLERARTRMKTAELGTEQTKLFKGEVYASSE